MTAAWLIVNVDGVMSDRFSTARHGSDPRAQALVGAYLRAGYRRIDPPLLQPAEPFLDLSGEDIRRRMFLTTDPQGREMCLRPDLTIPVSRAIWNPPRRASRPPFVISALSF